MSDASDYRGRYPLLAARRGVWREIVRYLRRDAPGARVVVELGAGYCDFINQFPAQTKLAFDLNPEMAAFADPEVRLTVGDAIEMPGLEPRSVDLVFASNFLEHLGGDEVERVLVRAAEVLRPGGRLILLQPNHRLCRERYFDDPTHRTIFDDHNIRSLLERHPFRVRRIEPGLLPFSMKSRLPKWPILIRIYLHAPLRPLAAQMYVVAERS